MEVEGVGRVESQVKADGSSIVKNTEVVRLLSLSGGCGGYWIVSVGADSSLRCDGDEQLAQLMRRERSSLRNETSKSG